jgi:hypothetical protein
MACGVMFCQSVLRDKKLKVRAGVVVPCIVLFAFLTGCGGGSPNEIRFGMTFDEVEHVLGKPNSIRRGITFLDSSRVAMVVRGSNLPVIQSSPTDERINWVYDISTMDTGALSVKDPGTGMVRQVYYSYTLKFCILFDPERKRVVYFGYYPFSVAPLR